jgi:uncharacterized protein (DUF433 family)
MSRVEATTTYQYLEPSKHPWRKQYYIKGRRMTVGNLVSTMLLHNQTPEEAAQDRGLPLEAVLEAMDYYDKHYEVIRADAEEEKQRLKAKGWNLD